MNHIYSGNILIIHKKARMGMKLDSDKGINHNGKWNQSRRYGKYTRFLTSPLEDVFKTLGWKMKCVTVDVADVIVFALSSEKIGIMVNDH